MEHGRLELEPAPDRALRAFGDFFVEVYEDAHAGGRELPTDEDVSERGVFWQLQYAERGPKTGPYWAAVKAYPRGIVLAWFPKNGQRKLTPEWHRLDRVVATAVDDVRDARRRD